MSEKNVEPEAVRNLDFVRQHYRHKLRTSLIWLFLLLGPFIVLIIFISLGISDKKQMSNQVNTVVAIREKEFKNQLDGIDKRTTQIVPTVVAVATAIAQTNAGQVVALSNEVEGVRADINKLNENVGVLPTSGPSTPFIPLVNRTNQLESQYKELEDKIRNVNVAATAIASRIGAVETAIAAIQTPVVQVQPLATRVASLDKSVEKIPSQISGALATPVAQLQSQDTKNSNDIKGLETRIKTLEEAAYGQTVIGENDSKAIPGFNMRIAVGELNDRTFTSVTFTLGTNTTKLSQVPLDTLQHFRLGSKSYSFQIEKVTRFTFFPRFQVVVKTD